ncbi:MAG TPA: M20/M25/M40 family metallo-hydrolase [Candidatus Acidoferrales bacterium]|nr:M20/M25/M40 family metallo-hydrolase [Candidatus Acidoferrales bacterium]
MTRRWLASAFLAAATGAAQTNPAAEAARSWRQGHENAVLSEFTTLLALPNLARDGENIRKNAAAVSAMFEKRGVKTQYLEVPGAPPVVYGEIPAANAGRTVIFYAHYDGQPLDPKEWATPPWEPVLRDGRIWARSASDDKAPFAAIAAALDALAAAKIPIRQNVKFVFEGEEEAGSPHLGQIISRYKDLLKSDVWLICDGPVHQSRRQQIVFGARGIAEMSITLYGPNHELHSGHYGNWAPNPAMALARLLASMKDDDGRVLIEHFYDGIAPLSETEERAVAEAPDIDRELMRELWLGRTEGGGKRLIELINLPSLNVRGMASSRVGDKASNVIPATATATIDMRLVKGIDPATAFARVRAHIQKQGYTIVQKEPDAETRMKYPRVAWVAEDPASYAASRTSMDLPVSQLVLRTAEAARGPIVKLPTMGGSVPLYMIEDILHAPTITVPIANHDNNQHSFNENIRVQNLWDGIELMAALLAM